MDSTLTPSSDLYSLGCVLFAVHMNGKPPFQTRGSMSTLRENAEGPLTRKNWASGSKWERCSAEVKGRSCSARLPSRQSVTDFFIFFRSATTSVDTEPESASLTRVPSLSSILLITCHQHPKLPRPDRIRLETTRGKSDLPKRSSEGPTDLFGPSET